MRKTAQRLRQRLLGKIEIECLRLGCGTARPHRGSAHQQNAERYLTYGREIRRIRSNAMAHMPASYLEAVREMEHLMLREIQDFCRDVKHSNYIF